MISLELRRALRVWRAVYWLGRAHRLLDRQTMDEVVELGRRLRQLLAAIEAEGPEGSSASVARATLNRMAHLLARLRRHLIAALRL